MPECALLLIFGRCGRKIEAWRIDYTEYRPHSSLDDLTPAAFLDYCKNSAFESLTLLGAALTDQMNFAAEKHPSTVSEKSSDQSELLKHFNAPDF